MEESYLWRNFSVCSCSSAILNLNAERTAYYDLLTTQRFNTSKCLLVLQYLNSASSEGSPDVQMMPPEIDRPTIPTELMDVIVDEVAHMDVDKASRNSTLASIALASWSLRHRAHKHLFATITFEGIYNWSATSRIRRLLRLFNDDPHSEITGIASYIKSFTVNLKGRGSLVRPTLDDGTMASIFRKLFKAGEPNVTPCSLSLTLGAFKGRTHTMFDWTTLNADFLSAFHSLCQNPLFTTLHLSGFINLPENLLYNSVVKNVKFSNIRLLGTPDHTFTEPSTFVPLSEEEPEIERPESPFREDQAVLLESIATDHSFPILEVLDMTPNRSLSAKLVYSKLKSLSVQIQRHKDLEKTTEMLADASSTLEHLEIALCHDPRDQTNSDPLQYGQLSSLKYLSVAHIVPSFRPPASHSIPHICSFLVQREVPPTLQTIEIALFLFTNKPDRTLSEIFDGHDYALIDELFSHPRFYMVKHLTIHLRFNLYMEEEVDEKRFKAEAASYVRTSFPEVLSVVANGSLEFDISIEPIVRRKVAVRR